MSYFELLTLGCHVNIIFLIYISILKNEMTIIQYIGYICNKTNKFQSIWLDHGEWSQASSDIHLITLLLTFNEKQAANKAFQSPVSILVQGLNQFNLGDNNPLWAVFYI
jgi:hypothetical protein